MPLPDDEFTAVAVFAGRHSREYESFSDAAGRTVAAGTTRVLWFGIDRNAEPIKCTRVPADLFASFDGVDLGTPVKLTYSRFPAGRGVYDYSVIRAEAAAGVAKS